MKNSKLRLAAYFLLLAGIQVGVWYMLTNKRPNPFTEFVIGVIALVISKKLQNN